MRNKSVTITFTKPGARAPEHLLANTELLFNTGILAGLRLTGLAVWRATANDGRKFLSVTFPTRAVERGTRVNYYDHLRGEATPIHRLKNVILAAYKEWTHANEAGASDVTEPAAVVTAEEVPF